jgi:hypothetical protein
MYETPTLQHLGSMRELTLLGGTALTDPFMPDSGCEGSPQGPITCRTPS